MQVDDLAEVHPIQLVAAEYEQIIPVMIHEMDHVFAHGIGRALVPGIIRIGLFGRQDFNEAAGEMVELV